MRKIHLALSLLLAAIVGLAAVDCGVYRIGAGPKPNEHRPAAGDAALDGLLIAMRERLLLMHEVARWKWNAGKPITDRPREEQLLADLEGRAADYGLQPRRVREFVAAQIEAGKLMQEADFVAWKEQDLGKFEPTRDLYADLRPQINEITDRTLALLAKVSAQAVNKAGTEVEERARTVLVGDGIDDAVRAAAIRPLIAGA